MSKITTQDCWLPDSPTDFQDVGSICFINGNNLEKHSNMVCLTKEDFEKAIGDAFDAGYKRCVFEVSPHNGKEPDFPEYITNLIK